MDKTESSNYEKLLVMVSKGRLSYRCKDMRPRKYILQEKPLIGSPFYETESQYYQVLNTELPKD